MIYMDGNLVVRWTRGKISTGNAEAFQFGRWQNDINAYFQGKLDDFRVYDSALSTQEIQQIVEGNDMKEVVIEHQFDLFATGEPTHFEVSGLPEGLLIDSTRGEVIGLPQEVGVFDLNISAFNIAGEGKAKLQLIVNKTAPQISSVSPRGVTSTSASFSAQVLSDGGEPINMSLFWGLTDGVTNANDWDQRVDLDGNFSDGLVSHLIRDLEKNTTLLSLDGQ